MCKEIKYRNKHQFYMPFSVWKLKISSYLLGENLNFQFVHFIAKLVFFQNDKFFEKLNALSKIELFPFQKHSFVF